MLMTLLPQDVAGWSRSIQVREINLPTEIREEPYHDSLRPATLNAPTSHTISDKIPVAHHTSAIGISFHETQFT